MTAPSRPRGAQYERWLNDPTDTSCTIQPATLTLEDLVESGTWQVEQVTTSTDSEGSDTEVRDTEVTWRDLSERGLISLDWEKQQIASEFGLSVDKVYRRIEITGDRETPLSFGKNEYEFIVGPRCLFAISSYRHDGPHWSEIALAVYRYYQREQLEWVFQINVVNEETNEVVQQELYTQQHRLVWPNVTPRAWLYGSQEFTSVLGTPNVYGVAAMVLGGFPDGNKTIREVFTWASSFGNWLQMAVHITDVQPPVVEQPAQPES